MKTNNKKSFEEMLSRNDYKRLTDRLKQRAEYIAKLIHKKMEELDISEDENYHNGEIEVNNVVVRICSKRSNGMGSYEYLAILRGGDDCYDDVWASLEDIGHSFYWCGDYYAWVEGANNKEALAFLNVAGRIIESLDKTEDKQVEDIYAVLNKTDNI